MYLAGDPPADAGPLWLKIVIAFVPPVLAAVIAGYFALSNTVNRRAERLKNLNDVRISTDTSRIDPGHALEKVILRELKELERTTSFLKYEKYVKTLWWTSIPIVYTISVLYSLEILHQTVFSGQILSYALGGVWSLVMGSWLFFYYWFGGKSAKLELDQRYDAHLSTLDGLPPQARKSANEPTPEAQKTTGQAAPKAQKPATANVNARGNRPGSQRQRSRNARS